MTKKKAGTKEKVVTTEIEHIELKTHRRILRFLNAARRPEDLMQRPRREIPFIDEQEMHGVRAHDAERGLRAPRSQELRREPLLDLELATCVLEARERIGPIRGFLNTRQLRDIEGIDARFFATMTTAFGPAVSGEWELLYDGLVPDETPIYTAHAALLHTGWVLFLPESFTSTETLLWNPEDGNPATAFNQLSGAATGLTGILFCGAHSFLQDGRLLVVGGGPTGAGTVEAWKFDPDTDTWVQTAGNMAAQRWYPTTLTLGDDSGRVLVVDGRLSQMEIYNESTDSFSPVWGPGGIGDPAADRSFPELYPGLHLLRSGEVFFTRTGNANGTDPAAYFTFSSPTTGQWTELTGAGVGEDRGQGMSAMLLRQEPAEPDRIMVVGGGVGATRETAGLIDVPPSASVWLSSSLPDNEPRTSVNVVLLPDGTVFVSGGMSAGMPPNGGACWIYDPSAGVGAGAWSEMDELMDPRQYHSTALLLPSGKVMTTGGSSERIEVFSPPYLFNSDGTLATRPDIASFPDPALAQIVLHGSSFEVGTADACDISSVVMVRPMAVTHQTDGEQRILNLSFIASGTTTLSVAAPDGRVYPYGASGGHSHAIAPRGYYMLFILNNNGVPSVAKFIRLV